MARGRGLGPVFAYEWLTTARRWQVYAGRVLFVGILLLGLSSVWGARVAGQPTHTIGEMAEVGRAFFGAIMFTQLTLVVLAAPAATAGTICQDKARGNLAQLLITDLSDAEIVLGKLASKLVPVLGLVVCTLPVLSLGTLLGGIDPLVLTGTLLITAGVAVLCCTIALAFSIWGTRTHEVLLATFGVMALWLLSIPIWEFFTWLRGFPPPPRWAILTNPFILAAGPYARPLLGVGLADDLVFLAGSLALSSALAFVATRWMRGVIFGQADRPAVRPTIRGLARLRAYRRPALDRNPVLWYERHRTRPTPWLRCMIRIYAVLAGGFSLLAIDDILRPRSPFPGWFPGYVVAFQVTTVLPLILISAATALAGERARGSLDVLLTTPLSTTSIVLAKWWGAFRALPFLLFLPMLITAALAWGTPNWSAVGLLLLYLVTAAAAWTSIGLALSTWIARIGAVVSWAVVLYALAGVGLPMLALTLFGPRHTLGTGLSMLSPFYGPFNITVCTSSPQYFDPYAAWSLGWSAANTVLAAGLLLATLATFNRRLGRIPERMKHRDATEERRGGGKDQESTIVVLTEFGS